MSNCENCRFWVPINEQDAEGTGECRRHAPRPSADYSRCGIWPSTEQDSWCGEHEPKDTGLSGGVLG